MKLKVQLVFPGTCEEAFNTYKEALKGEIAFLFRKRDDDTLQVGEQEEEKISHMVLHTPHFDLGGQDAAVEETVTNGSNTKLVLTFTNLDELHRVFNLLSQDAEIVSPLEKTFFCEAFGELVDRFGIRWLIMMTDDDYSA